MSTSLSSVAERVSDKQDFEQKGEWCDINAVCIVLILIGLAVSGIGIRKAVKSKFTDLDAIIWCFSAMPFTVLGALLSRFL